MHISSLLPLSLLFGPLSPASAIPVAESAIDGLQARHDDYHYGLDLAVRGSSIVARDGPEFWMESIKHRGISPLGPSGYTVFRNVKDFGAKGTYEGTLGQLSPPVFLYTYIKSR